MEFYLGDDEDEGGGELEREVEDADKGDKDSAEEINTDEGWLGAQDCSNKLEKKYGWLKNKKKIFFFTDLFSSSLPDFRPSLSPSKSPSSLYSFSPPTFPLPLLPPPSTHSVSLTDVKDIASPLVKVEAGLQAGGMDVPLQSVHVRAQLVDLAARVVVMQAYKNNSRIPIEAKYVFPLDDMAAVCGFEAFINGKHIIGEVKEKEQAHREYREAISKGHGAYLMDEETPVGGVIPKDRYT